METSARHFQNPTGKPNCRPGNENFCQTFSKSDRQIKLPPGKWKLLPDISKVRPANQIADREMKTSARHFESPTGKPNCRSGNENFRQTFRKSDRQIKLLTGKWKLPPDISKTRPASWKSGRQQ